MRVRIKNLIAIIFLILMTSRVNAISFMEVPPVVALYNQEINMQKFLDHIERYYRDLHRFPPGIFDATCNSDHKVGRKGFLEIGDDCTQVWKKNRGLDVLDNWYCFQNRNDPDYDYLCGSVLVGSKPAYERWQVQRVEELTPQFEKLFDEYVVQIKQAALLREQNRQRIARQQQTKQQLEYYMKNVYPKEQAQQEKLRKERLAAGEQRQVIVNNDVNPGIYPRVTRAFVSKEDAERAEKERIKREEKRVNSSLRNDERKKEIRQLLRHGRLSIKERIELKKELNQLK